MVKSRAPPTRTQSTASSGGTSSSGIGIGRRRRQGSEENHSRASCLSHASLMVKRPLLLLLAAMVSGLLLHAGTARAFVAPAPRRLLAPRLLARSTSSSRPFDMRIRQRPLPRRRQHPGVVRLCGGVSSTGQSPEGVRLASAASATAASTGVTAAGDIGPCPLLEAERLFPTCLELDVPPPVAGHVLVLRLPRVDDGDADEGMPDLSLLTERTGDDTALLGPTTVELLHPDELRLALGVRNPRSRLAFVGGRLALRRNLRKLPKPPSIKQAVLRDATGAPILPPRLQASISHKDHVAVCLLREGDSAVSNIGVDVEVSAPRKRTASIAPRVLTEKERGELGGLESVGISAESEILLRFSLKESVYKAIYPFVRRYVSFQEAEVEPLPDGTARIRLHLAPQADGRREGPYEAQGLWRHIEDGRLYMTAVVMRDVSAAAAAANVALSSSKL